MSENYLIIIRYQKTKILKLKKENYELKKRIKEFQDLMQPKALTEEEKKEILKEIFECNDDY